MLARVVSPSLRVYGAGAVGSGLERVGVGDAVGADDDAGGVDEVVLRRRLRLRPGDDDGLRVRRRDVGDLARAARGRARRTPRASGSLRRSRLALTSVESSVEPSVKVTPSRSVSVVCVFSALFENSVTRLGSTVPSRLVTNSESYSALKNVNWPCEYSSGS